MNSKKIFVIGFAFLRVVASLQASQYCACPSPTWAVDATHVARQAEVVSDEKFYQRNLELHEFALDTDAKKVVPKKVEDIAARLAQLNIKK